MSAVSDFAFRNPRALDMPGAFAYYFTQQHPPRLSTMRTPAGFFLGAPNARNGL